MTGSHDGVFGIGWLEPDVAGDVGTRLVTGSSRGLPPVAPEQLVGERRVRDRAARVRPVERDRKAEARCLGQADAARDHRLEDGAAEVARGPRAATSAERFVRASNIVRTTPLIAERRVQVVSDEIQRGDQL